MAICPLIEVRASSGRVMATSIVVLGLALGLAPRASAQASAVPRSQRFDGAVRAYEAADAATPAPRGAILLAGDSQFYRWKTLREDLPGYTVVNRGIDSFETSDLVHYADRLVLPYEPRLIVLHTGGNDVNNGKSAETILSDFKAFVAIVRAAMPDVPIAFTSITPSPGRWEQAPRRKVANDLVKRYIATQPKLLYIDLWEAMLTPDGQPREDLWVADRIHPNQAGYRIRVEIMKPILGTPR
jgi:lysophospholipase L1-like esterase